MSRFRGSTARRRTPGHRTAATVDRPFDPDDLPIEAFMSEEDRAFAASLPARAWAPGGVPIDGEDGRGPGNEHGPRLLRGHPLSLRSIAGRLLKSA